MPSPGKPQPSTSASKPASSAPDSQRLIWALAFVVIAISAFIIAVQSRSLNTAPPSPSDTASQAAPFQEQASVWLMEAANAARTRTSPHDIALPLTQRQSFGHAGAEYSGSPPLVAGSLLLSEKAKALQAFDLQTGKLHWEFAEKGSYISPAVVGQHVFIRAEANNQGQLYALDLETGTQRWAFTPKRVSAEINGFYGGHLTSPIIVNNVVFLGAGKEVYALDANRGTTLWEFAAQDYISSSPAIADGLVYISDFRYVYAIDQQTGVKRWAVPVQKAFTFAPVVTPSAVLVSSGDVLMALDPANGAERWRFAISGEALTPAGADHDYAYTKSTNVLYALDLQSGKEIWRYHNKSFLSFPAITQSQLFIVSDMSKNAALTALDRQSGKQLWSQSIIGLDTTAPTIAGTTIYVRTTDGRVLALRS